MTRTQCERTASADPSLRQLEATVRRMLHRASDPYRLAAFPLAQALCEATGIANAQAALRHVVDAAFGSGERQMRLRDLIVAADLEGRASRSEHARELALSRRHLQRQRAEAVAMLSVHIRSLIGGLHVGAFDDKAGPGDPLDALAGFVSHVEPEVAAKLYALSGTSAPSKCDLLELRGRLESGGDTGAVAFERFAGPARSLAAVLCAQADERSGLQARAKADLQPVLVSSDRGACESELRFELEWLAFLRARHRGDACELARIARNLRRIAQDRADWSSRAMLAQAEAATRRGALREAQTHLDDATAIAIRAADVCLLALACCARGEMELEREDAAQAERLASGAYVTLRGRHVDAYRALATVARARAKRSRPWSRPREIDDLPATAWYRIALDVEWARSSYEDGMVALAREQAESAYAAATAIGAAVLAARAAATVAAACDGDTRRTWTVCALSHLTATRDWSAVHDTFVDLPVRSHGADVQTFADDLAGVLYAALLQLIPQLGLDGDGSAGAARGLLRALCAYALDARAGDVLEAATAAVCERAGSFAFFASKFAEDFEDIVLLPLAAIAPKAARADVERRLRGALAHLWSVVRPGARQVLVG